MSLLVKALVIELDLTEEEQQPLRVEAIANITETYDDIQPLSMNDHLKKEENHHQMKRNQQPHQTEDSHLSANVT
jgi:hypothetical protein